MKNKLSFLAMAVVLLALSCHGQATNRLQFPISGFSIAPLEVPPGLMPQQALAMFLPATNGFAANVNVQIQPYGETLDDYLTLSIQQCKDAGFKLLQQNATEKTAVVFEYAGEMEGRRLHWYARAQKSAAKVYLVTATAPEDQWERLAPQLKACVDSLRCDTDERRASSRK
jgi:hypothetical protein